MNSKQRTGLSIVLGVVASAAYAAPALAADPVADYVTVILDQTGSMLDETNGVTRWVDAVKAARGVIAVPAYANSTTTAYGVWTFKQGDGQNGTKQIWPLAAADCPPDTEFRQVGTTGNFSNYCQPTDPISHADVLAKFDGFTTLTPQGEWLTPLADTLCATMQSIFASVGAITNKTIVFESDAGENVSTADCSGDGNSLTPVPWTYLTNVPNGNEWGMSLASWQAKVVRKLDKFNQPLATAVATPLPNTTETVFKTKLRDTYKVTWNVGVHYKLYPENLNTMSAMSGPSSSMQLFTPSEITDTTVNQMLQAPPTRVTITTKASKATATMAAVAASSTSYYSSMPATDLAFFKALGTSTTKSKFREVATIDGTVFGTYHRLPGDVDDSGCTDQADLNIIKQRDVWLQRAVLPLQIAIRADVSRDGWVDKDDVNVVVSNWAQGCINPVRPPKL
jgi:hypothetical protein